MQMDSLVQNIFKQIIPSANYIPTDTPGRLYIGSAAATRSDHVSKYEYGAVISLFKPDHELPDHVAHYYLPIEDEEHMTHQMQQLGHYLIPLIHHYLTNGHNVLIHCRAGMQRAPTIGVYYLMQTEGLTEGEAIKKIVGSRWVAFRHGMYFTFF